MSGLTQTAQCLTQQHAYAAPQSVCKRACVALSCLSLHLWIELSAGSVLYINLPILLAAQIPVTREAVKLEGLRCAIECVSRREVRPMTERRAAPQLY